jgi:hypothetical protein
LYCAFLLLFLEYISYLAHVLPLPRSLSYHLSTFPLRKIACPLLVYEWPEFCLHGIERGVQLLNKHLLNEWMNEWTRWTKLPSIIQNLF